MHATNVLWTSIELSSAEHFVLDQVATGCRFAGTVALLIDGAPGHISYEVHADDSCRTGRAEARITRSGEYTDLTVEVSGQVWTVNGQARDDLTGCIDIDLGWTPATNTLPMRRLELEIGASQETTAAWLRFPEMSVEATTQEYTRLGESRWRYRSGAAEYILETTSGLVVRRYGDDLWVAVSGICWQNCSAVLSEKPSSAASWNHDPVGDGRLPGEQCCPGTEAGGEHGSGEPGGVGSVVS